MENVVIDYFSELSYNRLGDMSEKGVMMLMKKEHLIDVLDLFLKSCVDCLACEQHGITFHSYPPTRRKYPLYLVHTNIWFINAKSYSVILYYVYFIDNYSIKVWVSLL